MKRAFLGIAAATATLAVAPAANAAVIGSIGQLAGPFASLSAAGLNGGALATLVGGSVFNSDQPFADIPEPLFGGNFLAAGPTPGQPATLTFTQPVTAFGFLIGSPDTYNVLTVTSTAGVFNFSPGGLGLATNGDQNLSQYVNFAANGPGELILSASFTNVPAINAFETANFTVQAIPEPGTWAMLILGFGAIGTVLRRGRKAPRVRFAI